MPEYVGPAVEVDAYLDELGNLIDYGHRWCRDSLPDNAYSVTSHLERFGCDHPLFAYRSDRRGNAPCPGLRGCGEWGYQSGTGRGCDVPADRVALARERLPDSWVAWQKL